MRTVTGQHLARQDPMNNRVLRSLCFVGSARAQSVGSTSTPVQYLDVSAHMEITKSYYKILFDSSRFS